MNINNGTRNNHKLSHKQLMYYPIRISYIVNCTCLFLKSRPIIKQCNINEIK